MDESKKPPHLRLVGPVVAHEVQTPAQPSLFPLPERNALFFVYVARASASEFMDLIDQAQPSWVIDVRVAPRFDFGRLTRRTVFAAFASRRCAYIDLGARLQIETRQDARWNPVFVAEELSMSFKKEGKSFFGPLLFLFDDEKLLYAADEKIPGALRPSPTNGWKTFVMRCDGSRGSYAPTSV